MGDFIVKNQDFMATVFAVARPISSPEKAKVHGRKSVDFLIPYLWNLITPMGWLSQSK